MKRILVFLGVGASWVLLSGLVSMTWPVPRVAPIPLAPPVPKLVFQQEASARPESSAFLSSFETRLSTERLLETSA